MIKDLFKKVKPVELDPRQYDRLAKEFSRLGREKGLILAANYAGGVIYYADRIEPKLRELGVPYELSNVKIERPILHEGVVEKPARVIRPTWREYSQLMDKVGGDPYHMFFDDNISRQALGSLLFYHWLREHGVQDQRIGITGVFSSSGVADFYVVKDFEKKKEKSDALVELIESGAIPETFNDERVQRRRRTPYGLAPILRPQPREVKILVDVGGED